MSREANQRRANFAADHDQIHSELISAGFALVTESKSGSRYYQRGSELFRVSDHPPTAATAAWLESVEGYDVSDLTVVRWLLATGPSLSVTSC